MRANTSLIGHIVGDHPRVSGYYETHNSYYSWKSLLRQKAMYSHPDERLGKFMFDKLLHDGHCVDDSILKLDNVASLICIREPIVSVKSAVAQFRKKRPEHEYTNVDTVVEYYIERLNTLERLSKKLHDNYFYYDAEAITDNTDELLFALTKYIKLESELKKTFMPKSLTGKGTGGDHSGNLLKGEVVKKTSNYEHIELSDFNSAELTKRYKKVREILINNSNSYILSALAQT
jgi:hypothetical protein